jgi:hypothetical protein
VFVPQLKLKAPTKPPKVPTMSSGSKFPLYTAWLCASMSASTKRSQMASPVFGVVSGRVSGVEVARKIVSRGGGGVFFRCQEEEPR